VDFKAFVDYLHELDRKKKHVDCVILEWLIIYKRLPSGYLFVKGSGSVAPVATTRPEYICARIIAHPHKAWYSQRIIHESYARSEQDLWTKLTNWSHNKDFNAEGFFHYWKVIDEKNYMYAQNVHPICPELWKELGYMEAKDMPELLHNLKEDEQNDLLQAPKRLPKRIKFFKLCIPPILAEMRQSVNNRRL
jgi:hypothetical protein